MYLSKFQSVFFVKWIAVSYKTPSAELCPENHCKWQILIQKMYMYNCFVWWSPTFCPIKCLHVVMSVITNWLIGIKYPFVKWQWWTFFHFTYICVLFSITNKDFIGLSYVLSNVSMLWCPLRFPHKNDVRFAFISSRAHVIFTVSVFACA
jgi:hypothetical protein